MPKDPDVCPLCESRNIRISYSRTVLDPVVRQILNRVPYRCRKCRLRFYKRHTEANPALTLKAAAAVRRWMEFFGTGSHSKEV